MNQPSGKIIEIGVAAGDYKTGEVFWKESYLVDPLEKLNPSIISLTGITDEMLKDAPVLPNAYRKMLSEIPDDLFINPVTWGGGDTSELREQLPKGIEWKFGRRWIDVKTIFVARCFAKDEKIQSGLSKSMNRMGLRFDGKKHRAHDDAANTLRMYFALLKELENV